MVTSTSTVKTSCDSTLTHRVLLGDICPIIIIVFSKIDKLSQLICHTAVNISIENSDPYAGINFGPIAASKWRTRFNFDFDLILKHSVVNKTFVICQPKLGDPVLQDSRSPPTNIYIYILILTTILMTDDDVYREDHAVETLIRCISFIFLVNRK